MYEFIDFTFLTESLEPALQLVTALALGMLLGAERTIAHKTAGLRTFGLVSMGSCLFVIISAMIVPVFSSLSNTDIMRVVAGSITGIGFLGAGIIIFKENTIINLTTAAGLWMAVGIGIAVGFELYGIAIAATVLTLIVFTLFWLLETKVRHFADVVEEHQELDQ